MKGFVHFKKIQLILDDAKNLVDSDIETIEWIEEEFAKVSRGEKK